MTAREELDLILGGIEHRKDTLADLDAKFEDLKDRTHGTQATNKAIWHLIELFSEAVQAADATSLVNLRLQRNLRRLTIIILVFTIIAAAATCAQVYYAQRADTRESHQVQSQPPPGTQPMKPKP